MQRPPRARIPKNWAAMVESHGFALSAPAYRNKPILTGDLPDAPRRGLLGFGLTHARQAAPLLVVRAMLSRKSSMHASRRTYAQLELRQPTLSVFVIGDNPPQRCCIRYAVRIGGPGPRFMRRFAADCCAPPTASDSYTFVVIHRPHRAGRPDRLHLHQRGARQQQNGPGLQR